MQFSKIATISALVAAASATDILSASQAPVADDEATVVTTRVTVTGYTTYCPYPTTITITVCEEETFCTESAIVVDEPATITVTEPCVIPTSYAERKLLLHKMSPLMKVLVLNKLQVLWQVLLLLLLLCFSDYM